jgi:hypothetical protein
MNSKKYVIAVLFVVTALFQAACSGNKEAATTAVNAAQESFNSVRGEAVQYVPDQAKGVEDALNTAKDHLAKGDYDAALTSAKAIPDSVKGLTAAIAAKKTELTASFQSMSAGMPKMLDAVKKRLDILSASKKLPANLDKAKFEEAKSGYEIAAKGWEDAKSAFSGGNVADAVGKASLVKEKAVEVMTALGMKVPAAAAPKG